MTENKPAKLDCMYKLAWNLENALTMVDEDWVLTDEAIALISEAKMDITQKTENIFKFFRFLESQVTIMKDEKKYIDKKKKTIENNIEKIRKLMQMWLDTVWVETDKKWKKTQKIKTLKWSVYYTFKENVSFDSEEIEEKYINKKIKLSFSDDFTLELLLEKCPELVEKTEIEETDFELLRFDYDRAIKNNSEEWNEKIEVPKWIKIWEDKNLCVRK